ncbi:type VII secretion protein EssB [Lactovum odontotermitis]
MRVSDGTTSLDLERNEDILQVRLLSTQFKEESLEVLPQAVKVDEEEETWLLSYPVPVQARSLASVLQKTKSRLDKLKLAQTLAGLLDLEEKFRIPFLHPDNIFLEGNRAFVIHFGLEKLMAPQEMKPEDFLESYKALILNIFYPKNSFESLVTGENGVNDKFAQDLNLLGSLPEVIAFIDQEVQKEADKVAQKITPVSKRRYRFFKYFGVLAIVAALVLGGLTYSYVSNNKKQAAIITAQTSFLTNNYAQTQTDLEKYSLKSLPKSARYVLAVSSVNLSDLTLTQKEAILNTVSTKSDDNTLNYWGYTGRGDFDQALNLAKNLGDTQLTLLAYTNLYEVTKLNSTMDGEKKQKLMEEYDKQIQELTKSLGK